MMHILLNEVCYAVGDLNLVEYSFLLRASRNEQGVSVKELKEEFSFYIGDAAHLSKSLVQKELAVLVRDTADRRGLALRTTRKGITRLTLLDETMVLSLMSANETITQESIEYLIDHCCQSAFLSAEKSYIDTLIPCEFTSLICRYQTALIRSSASVGLSSLHAVLLLLVDASPRAVMISYLVRKLRLPESILLPQLTFLEERRLLEDNGSGDFELGEEAMMRIGTFTEKSAHMVQELVQDRLAGEQNQLDELCRYCDYLFQ
ncbi:MAG: hypothetical protein HGA54_07970 [Actinobacteria bacterium]|nr:hypothetical protein [Actinomycetota bacterium]